jgi:hypothetical protein
MIEKPKRLKKQKVIPEEIKVWEDYKQKISVYTKIKNFIKQFNIL